MWIKNTVRYHLIPVRTAAAAAKSLQSWPHRWQPTRLPRPWDSPGKNTEWVAISFSNACVHACKVASVVSESVQPHGQQPTRLLCLETCKSKQQCNITSPLLVWLSSKSLQIINVSKDVEKRDHLLVHCWWKCKLVQPLWKTVQSFVHRATIWSSISI